MRIPASLVVAASLPLLAGCDSPVRLESKCELDARKTETNSPPVAADDAEDKVQQLVLRCMHAAEYSFKRDRRCWDFADNTPGDLEDGSCYQRRLFGQVR